LKTRLQLVHYFLGDQNISIEDDLVQAGLNKSIFPHVGLVSEPNHRLFNLVESFHEYRTTVFDQNVRDLQENPGLTDELGARFMDSVGDCVSERNLILLRKNRIIAIVFPGHTTNLFQRLDRVLFSVMKKNKDPLSNRTDDVSIHRQIWKCVRAYDQTAISFTIRSCFGKA
jgi:hypothetical protein